MGTQVHWPTQDCREKRTVYFCVSQVVSRVLLHSPIASNCAFANLGQLKASVGSRLELKTVGKQKFQCRLYIPPAFNLTPMWCDIRKIKADIVDEVLMSVWCHFSIHILSSFTLSHLSLSNADEVTMWGGKKPITTLALFNTSLVSWRGDKTCVATWREYHPRKYHHLWV